MVGNIGRVDDKNKAWSTLQKVANIKSNARSDQQPFQTMKLNCKMAVNNNWHVTSRLACGFRQKTSLNPTRNAPISTSVIGRTIVH